MRAIASALTACLLIMATPGYSLATPLTSSEKEELRKIQKETSIDIDGKATPDLVPYAIRWKLFFYSYNRYAAMLAGKISAEDSAILSGYSQIHADTAQRDSDERDKAFDQIMTRADSLDGVQLAVAFETTYQQSQEVARKRYDTLLSKLSPEGQRVVRAFAYAQIRPNATLENQVAVAVRAPELFKKSVVEAYALAREESRKLPVDAKPSVPSSTGAVVEGQSSSPTMRLTRSQ